MFINAVLLFIRIVSVDNRLQTRKSRYNLAFCTVHLQYFSVFILNLLFLQFEVDACDDFYGFIKHSLKHTCIIVNVNNNS